MFLLVPPSWIFFCGAAQNFTQTLKTRIQHSVCFCRTLCTRTAAMLLRHLWTGFYARLGEKQSWKRSRARVCVLVCGGRRRTTFPPAQWRPLRKHRENPEESALMEFPKYLLCLGCVLFLKGKELFKHSSLRFHFQEVNAMWFQRFLNIMEHEEHEGQ